MPFSLLDLEKNCTCDVMNLTHLSCLVLLHYLVKTETTKKMHSHAIQLLTVTTK